MTPRRIHLATGEWRKSYMVLSPSLTVHSVSDQAACGRFMIDRGQFTDDPALVTCDNCKRVAGIDG